MYNTTHTLSVKRSAIDVSISAYDYMIEQYVNTENKTWIEVSNEWDAIENKATIKKIGKGSVTTFNISTLRELDMIETLIGGNLSFQETQNMFREPGYVNYKMEEYLNNIMKEISTIRNLLLDQEDNSWFIDTEA